MLPSFRLITATFFCGFLMVFAGLRLAASLNDVHVGLPVMAAHAAPVTVEPAADQDMRRGRSAVPVMYDLHFAVSAASPILVSAVSTAIERPAPPLSIVPPADIAREMPAAAEPAKADRALAAIPPDTLPVAVPAARPDAAEEPLKPDEPAASGQPQ